MSHSSTQFLETIVRLRSGSSLDAETDIFLGLLTAAEKRQLLDGDMPFWTGMVNMAGGYNRVPYVMGQIDRVGLPGIRFSDGPRGIVMGTSTAFPVSMARGATWDVELEERIGVAIGREGRAQGANFFGGVCINLPRHPAWGRVQETYGEDPVLLGAFGSALVRGVKPNMMPVVKHFALNSMENARFTVDVKVNESDLHELYLPHFRETLEAGADGVMTSYNSVNGEWAGQNEHLLTAILRDLWHFDGVTVSDFIFGIRSAGESLRAGLDIEEPFAQIRATHLQDDLDAGLFAPSDIDRAARRIIRTQLRHYATRDQSEPDPTVVFGKEHRELSREVAARSIVLVKNEPVDGTPLLPLQAPGLTRVALIGRLAVVANTGDHGSSDVRAPHVTTAFQGLSDALPGAIVDTVSTDDPDAAAHAAAHADVALVIVGYTAEDEGEFIDAGTFATPALLDVLPPAGDDPLAQAAEAQFHRGDGSTNAIGGAGGGGDRVSLRLRDIDVDIIRAVAAANRRTVVAIVAAGAVIVEEWRNDVASILFSWYSGTEGGAALASILLGQDDASGRLPFSIPSDEQHLPYFNRDAATVTYDKWVGQRLLDKHGIRPAFPLGFGLSYTSFSLDRLNVIDIDGEKATAVVQVRNTGARRGRHVVQIYGEPVGAGPEFPQRVLLGFAAVHLNPGERTEVGVGISLRPLQRWGADGFLPSSSTARVFAAADASDSSVAFVEIAL